MVAATLGLLRVEEIYLFGHFKPFREEIKGTFPSASPPRLPPSTGSQLDFVMILKRVHLTPELCRWSPAGHSQVTVSDTGGVRVLLLEPQTVELSAELRHTSPLVAFERHLK